MKVKLDNWGGFEFVVENDVDRLWITRFVKTTETELKIDECFELCTTDVPQGCSSIRISSARKRMEEDPIGVSEQEDCYNGVSFSCCGSIDPCE